MQTDENKVTDTHQEGERAEIEVRGDGQRDRWSGLMHCIDCSENI